MKTAPTVEAFEIIEMIDDDADVFGQRSGGSGGDRPARNDTGPRRWVVVVAAAILGAAIGYGVITSAISTGAATIKPTPTSTPTTANAPTSSLSPRINIISPVFYVANPAPAGFTMQFAETLGMGGNTADFTNSDAAELWATDGATATTGSWFVVSRGTHHTTGRDSYRTVVGDIDVVVEHDAASGQARLSFTKDGNDMEITAFNWFDRQLLRLVASVGISNSAIHYTDTFFTTDHKRVLAADPTTALYGLPVAWVGYTTAVPAALGESFTITVAGETSTDGDVATRFALTNTSPFTVGAVPAIIGQSAADPRVSIAQWRDGERLITMRGNLDAERMATIAQTVGFSQTSAVKQQVDAGSAPVAPALAVEPETIVSGMLADGWRWTIDVSARNPSNPADGYLWWIGQPGDSSKPSETRASVAGGGPSIETFVEHGRTYVLAKVPQSLSGAKLRINPTGLASMVMALEPVNPPMSDEFAAYVFLQPVPLTAQILDSNGATVASWPSD